MKVRFQRGFFIEGYFFHPHRVEEVPDRFQGQLPPDATLIDRPAAAKRKPGPRRKKQLTPAKATAGAAVSAVQAALPVQKIGSS